MHDSPEPTAAEPRAAERLAGRRVLVLVLGDLGRSPRMRYHAIALARAGAEVELIGYGGTAVGDELARHPRVRLHLLPAPGLESRHRLPRPAFLAYSAARLAAETARLLRLVTSVARPDVLLLQIPPAFPSAIAAILLQRLRGVRLVVDWHNFSSSQLALTLGAGHAAARVVDRLERAIAPRADATLCVSRAMAERLRQWGAREPVVLYDRPASFFAPTPPTERALLLERLSRELALPELARGGDARSALLVSSTSWTPDEDFTPLEEALRRLASASMAPLVVLITGLGPLRETWDRRLRAAESERVRVRTLWLPADDYARLLGAADLGLCLHRSSSGLDLPMKIADMFGAGLPVCALDYAPVLAEILENEKNGLIFRDGEQLAAQLVELLADFPHDTKRLDALRDNVSTAKWGEEWERVAAPSFE